MTQANIMNGSNQIGKVTYKRMKRDEQYALMAGIAVWADDNKELVQLAQRLAHKTLWLGLCDSSVHHPFQIAPLDMFNADGNLYYELFLNIDHAAWGYFRLNIKSPTDFELICPKLAPWPQTTFDSEEEVSAFLDALGATLDDLYELSEAADERKWDKINAILKKLVTNYRTNIDPRLAEIVEFVRAEPRAMIADPKTGAKQFAKDLPNRFDLALLHPDNWYIARERTEEEKNIVAEVNAALDKNVLQLSQYATLEEETEAFRERLREFFVAESREAAFLYAAQRILAQKGFQVQVVTDSAEDEPDATNFAMVDARTAMVYVRPVLHATEIIVTDGPKPKVKRKSHHFGIPILE
jgi:hypothetical protein